MLRSEWRPGPQAGVDGPLFVSVTDFTGHAFLDLPGIARAGYGLRRAWPQLDGAVGMWLWAMPAARRSGSVSIWTSEAALDSFVRWPPHVAIMRKYRSRGRIRVHSWKIDEFDLPVVWRQARRTLDHERGPKTV
jgi:hypothetical protein